MNNLLDRLQALLLDPAPDYAAFRGVVADVQANLSSVELARSQPLPRLSRALEGFENNLAGTADVAVLLRQIIRGYSRRLRVRRNLWQVLSSRESETGLLVTDDTDPNTVEIQAAAWRPDWLAGISNVEIDRLEKRRYNAQAIGSGFLYGLTESTKKPFSHYRSEAQKVAVETSLFAPPGTTTLITLPTGGGKSMCIILPAWLEAKRGRIKGGTTLVVVPTVSLAHDQEDTVRRYFSEADDPEYRPYSLTSATPPDTRDTIRRGVRYGTLPILYISPESLLNSEFYQICLDAASNGTINRLVVDEVHLVETWGARFRTEFQLLASYRQKLMIASDGRLRTLLLSATVSNACLQTLKKLFANGKEFFTVQANRLRPELAYWFNITPNNETRRAQVLEALHHLPRPLILYVTKPVDAEEWVNFLRQEGFERLAAFSGKTDPNERQRLIFEWNKNQRDIMVATSAFGLGVDKGDVRAIVHAALPENTDRFYQEVGRAGRDGCSAISLVCLVEEDYEVALGMTTSARITTQKAWGRWQGMWQTAESFQNRGDRWLINTNAAPDYNQEMDDSALSQEWNEHVLLLLQRAGILSIIDTRPDDVLQTDPATNSADSKEITRSGRLLVHMHNPDAINEKTCFHRIIEGHRQQEKQNISRLLQQMKNLALTYSGNSLKQQADDCLAYQFADLYEPITLACGGCASCRQQRREPYAETPQIHLHIARPEPEAQYLQHDLERRMGGRRVLIVDWDGTRDTETLKRFDGLLIDLIGAGLQQLIIPEVLLNDEEWTVNLVQRLAQHRQTPHRVASHRWLLEKDAANLIYAIPTVILYSPDDENSDELYQAWQKWQMSQSQPVWVVHVVHQALYLPSQLGKFMARVDGVPFDAKNLQAWLKRSQTTLLF